MMKKQILTISLMAGCATLMGFSSAASSNPCGDGIARCACGDTVMASTRLRPSDPVVDANCEGNGLEIGADGITLNCRGLTLRGDGNATSGDEFAGVLAIGRTRITVKNCRVEKFWDGIRFDEGTTRSNIKKTKATYNLNDGISIEESSNNTVLGSRANRNEDDGFDIESGSDDNKFIGNQASNNMDEGMDVDSSNGNLFLLNIAEYNEDDGLAFGDGSGGNTVKFNRFNKNKRDGIDSSSSSDGNSFLFNTVSRNEIEGIDVRGNDTQLTGNRGTRNGANGVDVSGGEDEPNRLRKNVFTRSGSGTDICATPGNTNQGGNRVVVDFTGACSGS